MRPQGRRGPSLHVECALLRSAWPGDKKARKDAAGGLVFRFAAGRLKRGNPESHTLPTFVDLTKSARRRTLKVSTSSLTARIHSPNSLRLKILRGGVYQ